MTDYLEQMILNMIFHGQQPNVPSGVYVGLLTSTPTDSGGGTEVIDANYVRQQATFTVPTSEGIVTNDAVVQFPSFAATSTAQITHIALYDAVTGGNMLYYTAITPSIDITEGIGSIIQVGELSIKLG